MKVVSTKLSKSEQEALLEIADFLGISTAEYVNGCIMLHLTSSWDFGMEDELEPQFAKLMEKNEKRFSTTQV